MFEWLDNPNECAKMGIDAETLSILQRERDKLARDVSTTTSLTPRGFTKVKAPIPVTAEAKAVDAQALHRRVLEQRIQSELAFCQGCTGTCPKTSGRYMVPKITDGGDEVVDWCKFANQVRAEQRIRSSKIPDRYVGKTFGDYVTDNFNRTAVDFAKNVLKTRRGGYFYGECGTGKTFLASIVAQEFLRDGQSVVFVKVPNLLDDIRATFNGQGRELQILDELKAATLVVLDDFGMEKPSQWAGATLCKVLDMRYDTRSTTLITSNLSPRELANRLDNAPDGQNFNGSRIFDRLSEICKPILLKGTSRRE